MEDDEVIMVNRPPKALPRRYTDNAKSEKGLLVFKSQTLDSGKSEGNEKLFESSLEKIIKEQQVRRSSDSTKNIVTSELLKRLGPFRFEKQTLNLASSKDLSLSQGNSPKSVTQQSSANTKWVEIKYSDGSQYKG